MPLPGSTFLGNGWSFPPGFDRATPGVELVGAEEDIRQSIYLILSTEPGERVMQPEFGCALRQYAFRRMDVLTQTRIRDAVYRALLHWEPRIVVGEIRVEEGKEAEAMVHIGVEYTVSSTNTRFNVVFPYHLAEGSRLIE